ncbi:MAG: NUDIX domain-containing protein [Candidatus Izimaplasma sp.]|nr:NUDIX domain-containing protein [Candidatus Izimaplasma bacterium]
MIEIYDSNLTKEDIKNNTQSVACRGLVMQEDKVLVVHLTVTDIYGLPGGRLDTDELLESCLKREVEEETGYLVSPNKKTITIKEHFEGETFITHYYNCDIVSKDGKQSLTNLEQELGLKAFWMPLSALVDELSHNPTKYKFGPNIHQREFLGLMYSL